MTLHMQAKLAPEELSEFGLLAQGKSMTIGELLAVVADLEDHPTVKRLANKLNRTVPLAWLDTKRSELQFESVVALAGSTLLATITLWSKTPQWSTNGENR